MSPKRQLSQEGDELQNKRRHFFPNISGTSRYRNLEDFAPMLEPIMRNWVKEEVDSAIDRVFSGAESERRSLRLRFESRLPATIFTGNKIGTSPVKISLYDPSCDKVVATGPYSWMKVGVVVVQGDFDGEECSAKEFDSKVVQSRQGKRPLLNGEAIVALKDGVGYIHNLSFTDNSSWDRSGTFRLGLRVHSSSSSGSGEVSVREGVSNAFKVKDQRGESYQKHHPPQLNDQVWRLEKIGKNGASHKQLTKLGISNVGDLLRLLAMNPVSVRDALGKKMSNKKWETIVAHAAECVLDDKKYIYTNAQGSSLMFNSIYSLIGVTFDGLTYIPMHSLPAYQRKAVEELKQRAFENLSSWEICEPDLSMLPQTMGQGEVEMEMNTHHPPLENVTFEMGDASQMEGFNVTFNN
ncbi:calmodulin-binding protein 60 B-like [Salvia hispanica]|uniref:calmodulin-binding protein 60 B-like n=1 Tax=Salvia hispanica TaxID=49212 RepID=UPI002008F882|nr:calmodulin-binding protein 60 B-like [Salvia hispanica]XP_047964123.1 calmodulin-binding protein 60 B-like [Salvia hispanica]